MARVSIIFGFIFILLGVYGYVATVSAYPTALIPCALGVLLAIFGFLAQSPDVKKRKLYMHLAVTVGLLGFLGTAKSIFDFVRMQQGKYFAYPAAVDAKAAMACLSLIFVVLCVRSFVSARRAGVV